MPSPSPSDPRPSIPPVRLRLAIAVVAVAFAAPAHAQPARPDGKGAAAPDRLPEKGKAPDEKDLARAQRTEDARPWARGVSPERQQKALKTFAEANALLRDALFVKAAEKYREALGS